MTDIEKLADAFIVRLRQEMTDAQWVQMIATDDEPNCASHDYCDANIPMLEAFEDVYGRPLFNLDNEEAIEADCQIVNAAWAAARKKWKS